MPQIPDYRLITCVKRHHACKKDMACQTGAWQVAVFPLAVLLSPKHEADMDEMQKMRKRVRAQKIRVLLARVRCQL